MTRKLSHSLLLIVVVAALMIGGDIVQEGRSETWHIDPGKTVASDEAASTGAVEVGINEADGNLIANKKTCANSRFDW
jgi:hypothetical protein